MKRTVALTVVMVAASFCCPNVWAQDEERPEPLRDRGYGEKLKWLVGDWELQGQLLLAGKPPLDFVGRRHLEWTLGNNFLSTTMVVKAADKERSHKSIIGWDRDNQVLTEWGFWDSGNHEIVVWTPEGDKWLITREGLKGVYTILGPNKHRYEAEFVSDDGKRNRWHFTADRMAQRTKKSP